MDGYNAGSCMVSKTKTAAKANSGSIIQYQLALISPSASPRLTEVVQGNLGTSSKLNFFSSEKFDAIQKGSLLSTGLSSHPL